tara:strand:+ start:244 stop:681 length:438 start_codon:yes stop_codon:yes gene_type:complete
MMNLVNQKEPIEFFQGEYRWLSNFWPCEVEFEGIIFPSVEHAYQAAKFHSMRQRMKFLKLTAGQAKRAGAKAPLTANWDHRKLTVMWSLVKFKFTENNDLLAKLKSTKGRELIEGNTWGDTFWGQVDGKGINHLGKMIMMIRELT